MRLTRGRSQTQNSLGIGQNKTEGSLEHAAVRLFKERRCVRTRFSKDDMFSNLDTLWRLLNDGTIKATADLSVICCRVGVSRRFAKIYHDLKRVTGLLTRSTVVCFSVSEAYCKYTRIQDFSALSAVFVVRNGLLRLTGSQFISAHFLDTLD